MTPTRRLTEGELRAKALARRMDPYMVGFGLVWLLAFTLEPLARTDTAPRRILDIVQAATWFLFIAEFLARLVAARSTVAFLRDRWWEILILALPVFRFIRILRVLRFAHVSRAVTPVLAPTRSPERNLTTRLLTLALVTIVIVLVSGRALFEWGEIRPYASALHEAVFAGIKGDQIVKGNQLAATLEVALAIYSVVVLGVFVGALGDYLTRERTLVKAPGVEG